MKLKTILIILLFFITFTSVSQIIGTTYKLDSIEIAQYDLPTTVTWYNAKRECKELGKGWRLPTKEEFQKEILEFASSKKMLTYYECKYLFKYDAITKIKHQYRMVANTIRRMWRRTFRCCSSV